jgi:hypothetical protein
MIDDDGLLSVTRLFMAGSKALSASDDRNLLYVLPPVHGVDDEH